MTSRRVKLPGREEAIADPADAMHTELRCNSFGIILARRHGLPAYTEAPWLWHLRAVCRQSPPDSRPAADSGDVAACEQSRC